MLRLASRFATAALVAAGAVTVTAGCGDDPISYSAPVGITLDVTSNAVAGGRVGADKNINTESGNPYAAFMADAEDELGGNLPDRIEVEGLDLLLEDTTTGVTALGEIWDGTVEVSFEMNDSGAVYPVATLDVIADTGAGPLAMEIGFDSGALTAEDYTRLADGGFKVLIDGPAQGDFEGASADANLSLTFTFGAYND